MTTSSDTRMFGPTPAPWEVSDPEPADDPPAMEVEIFHVADYGAHRVAVVSDDYKGWLDDARLIAAAPDLLAALNRILAHTNPQVMWDIANAAIAKAGGEV